jgi:hypothetical protein
MKENKYVGNTEYYKEIIKDAVSKNLPEPHWYVSRTTHQKYC